MPLALFGITDDGLNLAVNLVIFVLVVLWLALAYWTFADARRRIADPVLVTTATVVGLVPFLGPLVYTILRPPEFLEDVREREIETQASELRMRHLVAQSCPRCEHPIERSWLRCPECRHRLKDPCVSCSRPVDPRWSICPYCETQLRREERATGGSRRSERSSPEPEQRPAERAEQRPAEQRGAAEQPRRRSEPKPKAKSKAAAGGGSRGQRKPRQAPAPSSNDAGAEPSSSRPPRRRSTSKS